MEKEWRFFPNDDVNLMKINDCEEDETSNSSVLKFLLQSVNSKLTWKSLKPLKLVLENKVNPPKFSKARQMTREFIGGEDKMDFRYWSNNLGSLIKLHLDSMYDESV